MRLTIETGAQGDEQEDLLARAYVASVVGPFRRPNGRSRTVNAPAGVSVELTRNATPNRVLHVSVSGNPSQLVGFTTGSGASAASFITVQPTVSFVLMPGEQLAATAVAGLVLTITENVF